MSRKIVLFSEPTPEVIERLGPEIFPETIKNKVFAYMPSDGSAVEANEIYTPFWKEYAQKHGAEFVYIDNSKVGDEAKIEKQKLASANILMITGGNTYKLLKNLRDSGFDGAIIDFWKKEGTVVAGFSAGALVLTPTILLAKTGDANEVGLTDLTGLGLVDFEVWPHFSQESQADLDAYSKSNPNVIVKPISNSEFIIINQ